MGTKGTNTTTNATTTAPNQTAMNAYTNVLNQAQGVAATPYQAYTGEGVAPFNTEQNQGVSGINQYANAAQPNLQQASSMVSGAANPLTQQQIQSYMSPYTQDVVNATQAQFNNQNQQQQQGVVGNAIAQGALGGNRSAIAQSEMANQQQLAQAPVIAGLENQGYQTGLQTATQQYQTNPQAAASLLGNLGVAGQTAGLQGAGSQLGAGTQQQSTQQALDTYLQQQYNTAQAYPFQTTQWLAGLDTGVGSQMGGTSVGETTAPAPSVAGQVAGGVTSAAGLLGATGAYGSAGWLAPLLLSDVRAKENIKSVGKLNDGQIIFRFNYKGDPTTHIGLLAQNVEKGKHPEAVHTVNGLKHVDYKAATEDAIKRAMGGVVGYASGGAPSNGVAPMPWANAPTWIPQNTIAHGAGAPHISAPSAYQAPQQSNQASQIGALAKDIKGSMDGPAFGGGSLAGGDVYGGSAASPASNPSSGVVLNASDYGPGFADGGVVDGPGIMERFARSIHNGRDLGQRALYNNTRAGLYNSETAPEHGSTYGGLGNDLAVRRAIQGSESQDIEDKVRGYADGGSPGDTITDDDRLSGYDLLRQGLGVKAPDSIPGGEPAPSGVVHKDDNDNVINPDEPYRMPDQKAVKEWRAGVDKPNPAMMADVPEKTNGIAPTRAMAFSGDPDTKADVPPEVALGYSAHGRPESQPPAQGVAPSSGFDWSSNNKLWPSLISAGFGMLASRAPNFGNVIGEGGQAGVGAYNAQTKAEQDARQHAEQLELERERLERPYSEMTMSEKAADARAKSTQSSAQINQAVIMGPNGKPMVNPDYVKAHEAIQKDFQAKPGVIDELQDADGMVHKVYGYFDPATKKYFDSAGNPYVPKGSSPPAAPPAPPPPPGVTGTPSIPPAGSTPPSQSAVPVEPVSPSQVANSQAASIQTNGTIGTNNLQAKAAYDYANNAPVIEKGMDVPEPNTIGGRSVAALKTDAERYLETGTLPPTSRASTPAAILQQRYAHAVQNYATALAQSRGLTPEQLVYAQRTAPGLTRFILGQDGRAVVSLGVAVSHLDSIQKLAEAWGPGNVQVLNQIKAAFAHQFGDASVTNLESAAHIVGPEIIKALGVAGAGTYEDREKAAQQFASARTPDQIRGAVHTVQTLLAGQLEGKERQAAAIGIPEKVFQGLVGDRAYGLLKNLGGSATQSPADKAALDWANANSNDPRAAAIKKKLGVQ